LDQGLTAILASGARVRCQRLCIAHPPGCSEWTLCDTDAADERRLKARKYSRFTFTEL
jgi:hypothetical protein